MLWDCSLDVYKPWLQLFNSLEIILMETHLMIIQVVQVALQQSGSQLCLASSFNNSNEELKDLFSFNHEATCDTHSLINCNCDGDGSNTLIDKGKKYGIWWRERLYHRNYALNVFVSLLYLFFLIFRSKFHKLLEPKMGEAYYGCYI